jgi:hypothetical protein
MYDLIYAQFYHFAKWLKEIPGNGFHEPPFDAVCLMSVVEAMNVATIWILFDFKSITGYIGWDSIFCIGLFFFINWICFLRGNRYKEVIIASRKKSSDLRFGMLFGVLFYSVFSIFALFWSHSEMSNVNY